MTEKEAAGQIIDYFALMQKINITRAGSVCVLCDHFAAEFVEKKGRQRCYNCTRDPSRPFEYGLPPKFELTIGKYPGIPGWPVS